MGPNLTLGPQKEALAVRISRWLVGFAVAVAACGSGSVASTTEPLLDIATTTTAVPAVGSTVTEGPDEDVLSPSQREAVDLVTNSYGAADAATIIGAWDIASDRRLLFAGGIEFDIAIGGRWFDSACGLSLSGDARCEMLYTNDLLEALGAPMQESVFRIGVRDDGAITSWFYETGNVSTVQALVEPFRDWITETHPELFDAMFNRGRFARVTPESREIWVEMIAEFAASLSG
ncbi:MAG: hypothetical protein GY720_16135 [bacterium]|nr:hypothetical protein [bacterium]